jgi:hypothetical protein
MSRHKTVPLSQLANFVGISTLGPIGYGFGPTAIKNNLMIYKSENIDLDISTDGIHWFHLFGSRCCKKLKDFQPD